MEMSSVYACDSHARLPPGRPLTTYKDAICRRVWGHAKAAHQRVYIIAGLDWWTVLDSVSSTTVLINAIL